jgi:hypothetical protein
MMGDVKPPFCRDCRHSRFSTMPTRYPPPAGCAREVTGVDLVTGEGIVRERGCRSERRSERTLFGREKCGPDGRYFEERPAPPPAPEADQ